MRFFTVLTRVRGFLMENNFAILRTEKLKTFGNIGGSLAHNFRDIETPNADADRTVKNSHSLKSSAEVMDAIQLRLPEKRRSDAVLCIEHLITASPTWSGWGTENEHEFFENSKKWLEKQYGSKNVVAVSIHRDETTPHLIAYVVPLDEATGKFNAKKWLGGRAKMSQMQSDFANQVKSLGLERGIEGSKAKHTRIKEYYAKVNQDEVEIQRNVFLPDAEYDEDITRRDLKNGTEEYTTTEIYNVSKNSDLVTLFDCSRNSQADSMDFIKSTLIAYLSINLKSL